MRRTLKPRTYRGQNRNLPMQDDPAASSACQPGRDALRNPLAGSGNCFAAKLLGVRLSSLYPEFFVPVAAHDKARRQGKFSRLPDRPISALSPVVAECPEIAGRP